MRFVRNKIASCVLAIIFFGIASWAQQTAGIVPNHPLTVEEVVKNLQEKNRERTAALHQFQGMRVYRMQYRGFPNNRDAEMVVAMSYQAPNTKEFSVVSQNGSKFIIDHVFKKLLEGELEAMSEENRQHTALNSENYDFTMAGYETTHDGAQYVLNTIPKSKNKFLYRGKIWVDAKDFAVTRIDAEPAKNPSFWIKKTQIQHKYIKVNNFWFPLENRSESSIRLGGKAVLSIEYKDYKIKDAAPLQVVESAHENANGALSFNDPAIH
jgi:outer membrane lipoprotein-sorting protein